MTYEQEPADAARFFCESINNIDEDWTYSDAKAAIDAARSRGEGK